MTTKLNLRELKGAPLSIILAIVMAGNRTVSVSWLVTETGYSDKTINSGLDMLRSRQIITQTGRCRYQLTGENVQLPLYWGEKVEPANPSPASDQPALFELGDGAENFSGKNSGFGFELPGKFPETGISPALEKRVSALEKRVSELEKRSFSGSECGISPKNEEFPVIPGEFSDDEINSSSISNPDIDKQKTDDEGEYRQKFLDIYQDYKSMNGAGTNPYSQIHGMEEFSDGELEELISLHADPDLAEFVLPRAAGFESAKKWLKFGVKKAKYELCKKFGIYGKKAEEFSGRDDISLWMIDYHYWYWRMNEGDNNRITLGTVIFRIDKHFDNERAENSLPKMCGYLD